MQRKETCFISRLTRPVPRSAAAEWPEQAQSRAITGGDDGNDDHLTVMKTEDDIEDAASSKE